MPKSAEALATRILPDLGRLTPVWYSESEVDALPKLRRPGRVWIVNGSQLPLVDWPAATAMAGRNGAEIILFGSPEVAGSAHYAETVVVSEAGEVVRFKRHYCDSPTYADPWSGEASFLVTSDRSTQTTVNHLLARGWGMDSIGALTRRFSVRWSTSPCVLAELESRFAEATSDPLADVADEALAPTGPIRDLSPADVSLVEAASSNVCNAKRMGLPTNAAPADASGGMTYSFVKRTIDVVGSLLGLIVLSPFLVIVAVLVKCTSRGPVLFGHTRQGLRGKEFKCLKFRSMRAGADLQQAELRARNEVDGPQFKIEDDPRLTSLGSWLRSSNVDELPQLINVLLGQMTLVGPRPSPDAENQLCPAWRRTRLSVKPGITGLWQVLRLRNQEQSDFQEWIYYDTEYARHRSLWLDLQTLVHTPISMFLPGRISGFSRQLKRRGICKQSAEFR